MTVQITDSLDIEGMHAMVACDMFIEPHPRIVRLSDEAAEESCAGALSTACHREFWASWAIKVGKLYLVDVIGRFVLVGEELLFAEWYSGTICAGAGKMLRRPTIGYGLCEREFEIEVQNGIVLQQREWRFDSSGNVIQATPDAPPYVGELPSWIRKK
jgi:hypothetical protein